MGKGYRVTAVRCHCRFQTENPVVVFEKSDYDRQSVEGKNAIGYR